MSRSLSLSELRVVLSASSCKRERFSRSLRAFSCSYTSVCPSPFSLAPATPAHTFAVGDYVATVDGGDTDGFTSDFESAASSGKKVTAISDTTITTDYDSSSASADYAVSSADVIAGTLPQIQKAVLLTAGGADVVVEQVQIVGG